MLPNESNVRRHINQKLSDEFTLCGELLSFGIELINGCDLNHHKLNRASVVSTVALLVKATTTFRSVQHLCEVGLDRIALPLCRSLFENLLNLAFLLRPKVSLCKFEANGNSLPWKPDLQQLTCDFRAALYNAWCILKDERHYSQAEQTPGIKRVAKRATRKIKLAPRPFMTTIGPKWEGKLLKGNTCTGLTVADFAASLGKGLRAWYRTVYAGDSNYVHQSDMISYIDVDMEKDAIEFRWHTSPEEIKGVLARSGLLYLCCIQEMCKRFRSDSVTRQKLAAFEQRVKAYCAGR